MKTTTRILTIIVLTGMLGACMFHGGEQKHVSAPTLGQELSDLKVALDGGAISDQEYQEMRARIINSCVGKTLGEKC